MVVQHNMQAMNANRMLNITTGSQAKSTEKLSSGYRINRAADDAAGLTISEKMRKQMRGLDRASTNAEDGVSAVQTAEGALTEVHSMLQRMNELANQASNGSNSKSDRDAIQAEIEQLTTEIDRVAETTKFNETYLLKGNSEGTSSEVKVAAHDAGLAGKLVDNEDGTSTFTLKDKLKAGSTITIANENYEIGESKTVDDYAKLGSFATTKLQIGDSVTKADGTELIVTDRATIDDVEKFLGTKGAANDPGTKLGTLTLADGTKYEFTNGAADKISFIKTDASGKASASKTVTATIAATSKFSDFTDGDVTAAKLAGATFTSADGKNTYTLVTSLNRDELTLFDTTNGKNLANGYVDDVLTATRNAEGGNALATALAVGDTVTTITTDSVTGNKTETSKTAYLDAADSAKTTDELAALINAQNVNATINVKDYTNSGAGVDYTLAGSKDAENGNTLTADSIIAKLKEGDLVTIGGTQYSVAGVDSKEGTISVNDAYQKIANELQNASSIGTDKGKEASVTSNGDGSFSITQGSVEVADKLSFSLHVGADADMTNKIGVDIDSMSAAGLGIKGINVSDDSGVAATYAIDAISDAIAKVSEQRSALGAVQNRLEHTIANLDNVVENTTSAESRIRDTDMASEMVEFSKNNILAQAGQSMLAQANQSNQGVLSLLG